MIVSLIEELMDRNGLALALVNRNDKELLPSLKFINKHVRNADYAHILTVFAEIIIGKLFFINLYDI